MDKIIIHSILFIIIFIIIFIVIAIYNPNVYSTPLLTDEEIIETANLLHKYEIRDSLNIILVASLKYQVSLDSLAIASYKSKIELLEQQITYQKELLDINKPKWYESKLLYFSYGCATIIVSSFVLKNTIQ